MGQLNDKKCKRKAKVFPQFSTLISRSFSLFTRKTSALPTVPKIVLSNVSNPENSGR